MKLLTQTNVVESLLREKMDNIYEDVFQSVISSVSIGLTNVRIHNHNFRVNTVAFISRSNV